MKNLTVLLLLFSVAVFAAAPKKFTNDVLQFGGGSNGSIKELIFNTGAGTNPTIRANSGDGSLLLRPDAVSLGDGTASDKELSFDIGQGANNPKLFWDNAAGALSFTNDGTLIKKIGSGNGSGGAGGINLLSNASFEDPGTPILNWTNSGGTLTQEDLTNGREANLKFARFVATGAGQYVESDAVTISDDVGFGCMADVFYVQGDNAFTLKVLKEDLPGNPGTFNEVASGSFSDLTSFLKLPTVTFPCEGGDSFKVRYESTGAGTIDLDVAYLGSNKNINPQGKSAAFVGSIEWMQTVGCSNFNNSTNFADFSTDADCDDNPRILEGDAVDSSNGIAPEFQINNLRAGHYQIVVSGVLQDNTSSQSNTVLGLRASVGGVISSSVTFGSSTFGIDGTQVLSVNIPSDQVNSIVKLQGYTNNASDALLYGATSSSRKIAVYYYPTTQETQEAFTPEQAEFEILGSIGGSNFALASSSEPSSQQTQDPNLVLTTYKGDADITCVGAPSTGSTCSGVNERVGVSFNAPVAGQYEICMEWGYQDNSSTAMSINFAFVDTSVDGLSDSASFAKVFAYQGSPNEYQGIQRFKHCDTIDYNSVGTKNVNLVYRKTAGAAQFFTLNGASNSNFTSWFSVRLLKNDVATPRLLNQVSTRARLGTEKGVCLVQNNGAVSFDSSDPDCWFLNALTRNAAGIIEVNFIETGFKCLAKSLQVERILNFQQTGSGAIDTATFPQTVLAVTRITSTGNNDDQPFSISCSKNK